MLDIVTTNIDHRSAPQAQVQFEAQHMRQNGDKFTLQALNIVLAKPTADSVDVQRAALIDRLQLLPLWLA